MPGSRQLAAALAAASVAAAAGGGPPASAGAATARATGDRILLASDRDGVTRGYSVRLDGSRLTPLLPRRSALVPTAVSRDGTTVAYVDPRAHSGIYISRADGTGLRRVVRGKAGAAALSGNGRFLAYLEPGIRGIWIVGTDGRGRRRFTSGDDDAPAWSPDGRALLLLRTVNPDVQDVVVRPLRGRARVVRSGDLYSVDPSFGLEWSPDGRWIAYAAYDEETDRADLWLVRPNGDGLHRIARDVGVFAWSPGGRRLAFASEGHVLVAGLDGRGRPLGIGGYVTRISWLPDGRRLALTMGQIWIVAADGNDLRRITGRGDNTLVGFTRLAPVLPVAAAIPPTERVAGPRTLSLRARVTSIAADGGRVAFVTGSTRVDCAHVAVWRPSARSIRRFGLPYPCPGAEDTIGPVALGGTRAAWLWTSGGPSHTQEMEMETATLGQPGGDGIFHGAIGLDTGFGTVDSPPVGGGGTIAFAVETHCDESDPPGTTFACPAGQLTGYVSGTTVYRFGGPGPCEPYGPRICTRVVDAEGELRVLAVDAERIVVATGTRTRVLGADGRLVREFAVGAGRAAVSGERLALETPVGIELYDLPSGRLTRRYTSFSDLQALEGELLGTDSGGGYMVRRISDGRRTLFPPLADEAFAELDSRGLFRAGGRRIVFTPMREILRRLGG